MLVSLGQLRRRCGAWGLAYLRAACLALGLLGAGACRRDPTPIARDRDAPPSAAPRLPAPAPPPSAEPPRAELPHVDNVLLLTVDALRADQPWTGYRKVATPHLSELASRSVVYTHAYAVANTTTPSLAAMMSARYPTELPHDMCALAGFRYEDSLAQVLSRAGVHTFAAHGHAIFASTFAPSAGFEEWKLVERAGGRLQVEGAVTGEDLATLVVSFLTGERANARFFAWAHFVDPHDAYVAHSAFPASSSPLRGLYDGEVAYTDHQIGRVLAALDRSGLAARTAVIVTADHGEAFGEHQRHRHGFTLHEEEVRVPLIVHVPGVAPARVKVTRSTIDLARSVAALMRIPPAEAWRGASWVDDFVSTPVARVAIVDTPELVTLRAQRAVIAGKTKVMFRGDHAAAAYDLATDPREERPLKASDVARLAASAREVSRLPEVPGDPCHR